MKKGLFSVLTFMLISVSTAFAQEEGKNQFDLDLNMVGRGELRYGGFSDGESDNSAKFIMERTRLTLGYKRPYLEAKVSAQHSGIWGERGKGSFNLYEAWAKLNTKFGLFAKVGRQSLSYDDERIIGANDWAMLPLSHDVVKLGYEGFGHKVHAIFAFNQNGENVTGGSYYTGGAQPYKVMHTLWYHYDVPKIPLGASLLFMNIGMQAGVEGSKFNPAETVYQQLIGGYVSYQAKRWSIEGAYYHQLGTTVTDNDPSPDEVEWTRIGLDAWMASVKAQLQITNKVGVQAGYDYLSGDDYPYVRPKGMVGMAHHEKIKYFNPVYGSHHKFYGMMDFFFVQAFSDSFSPGLQNLYAGASYSPLKGLDLKATYHYLATATNLENTSKTLGHDIDIEASYRIWKDVSLSLGFSYMVSTETMQKLQKADEKNNLKWAWLSLVVSPRLVTKKW